MDTAAPTPTPVRSEDTRQRLAALCALGWLGAPAVILMMLKNLADEIDARICDSPHSRVMAAWAARIAQEMNLSPQSAWRAMTAARVHDVGKVIVPEDILIASGPLSDDEWDLIRKHPAEGRRLLSHVPELAEVARIVGQHHERFDGCGYPSRLSNDDIAVEARIVSVCDAWAAMRAHRPYRAALDVEASRAELRAGAGRQFHPEVVEAFLSLEATGEVGLLYGSAERGDVRRTA
jgi:HD-GYP domain-containing protein (c-di-GMP phosphodiesterase class II)